MLYWINYKKKKKKDTTPQVRDAMVDDNLSYSIHKTKEFKTLRKNEQDKQQNSRVTTVDFRKVQTAIKRMICSIPLEIALKGLRKAGYSSRINSLKHKKVYSNVQKITGCCRRVSWPNR